MAKNLRLTDTVTIASSGTTSTTLTLENNRIPLALVLPATMTGTSCNFKASSNGTDFYTVYDDGTLYAPTTAASRFVALKRQPMEAVKYFQIVSTSTETATRTIGVISGE